MDARTHSLVSLLAGGLIALAGCGAADSPIRIGGARALKVGSSADGICEAEDSYRIRGALDLAGSMGYLARFDVESSLLPRKTVVGDEELSPESQTDFISELLVFRYSSMPSLPFEEEAIPVHFILPAKSEDWILIDLLGPKAARILRDSVTVGNSVDVEATFHMEGRMAWGGGVIRSNRVVFPLTVFDSGAPACAAGVRRVPNGPCGGSGGQDGTVVACCDDPLYADACAVE